MPPSTFWQVLRRRSSLNGCLNKRFLAKILGVIFLIILICIEIGPLIGPSVFAQNTTLDHTRATVNDGCRQFSFSSDGNPFPLCPGPFPVGGNCVWWGWEMWHLLVTTCQTTGEMPPIGSSMPNALDFHWVRLH